MILSRRTPAECRVCNPVNFIKSNSGNFHSTHERSKDLLYYEN